jgi:hypothetical protein
MIGGCGGGGDYSPAFPVERGARLALLYVADTQGDFIDVFRLDGTRVARITDGLDHPIDLFVDREHDLWVANNGNGEVLRYRRGTMRPAATYYGVPNAWDLATCPDGRLYVTTLAGNISVFARGHHHPTGFLDAKYGFAISVACDPAGNVFATASVASPPGYVVEFPSGSDRVKLLPINVPNPVDAKPDPAGHLLVLDSAGGSYNAVTEFTEAGHPTEKSMPTGANWNEMAIAPKGNGIFGADFNHSEGVLRAFPSGTLIRTYLDSKFSQLGGIAYDPR